MTTEIEYFEPTTIEETCALLKQYGSDARPMAGGVVLMTLMRQRLVTPNVLISLRQVAALRRLEWDDKAGLFIGALTTHRTVETVPLIRVHFPVLSEMERDLGSVQIRNAGTLGGNLCHADPAEDPAPVLIALGSTAHIVSVKSPRAIPLAEFFVDYLTTVLEDGEILTGVTVPPLGPGSGVVYLKQSARNAVDFPVASVAVRVTLDKRKTCKQAIIVLGAAGPTPLIVERAGQILIGESWNEALAREAGQLASLDAQPVTDVYGSEEYKRHVIKVLTRRAVEAAWQQASQSLVE